MSGASRATRSMAATMAAPAAPKRLAARPGGGATPGLRPPRRGWLRQGRFEPGFPKKP